MIGDSWTCHIFDAKLFWGNLALWGLPSQTIRWDLPPLITCIITDTMTMASAVTEICINILFGYFCVYFRGDDEAQEKFVNYLKVGPRWLKYRFVFFWIIIFGLWWQRAAYVCANAIHNCLDTGGVSTGDILHQNMATNWHRCFSKYFLPGRSIYIVHKFEKRLPLDFFFFLIGSCLRAIESRVV